MELPSGGVTYSNRIIRHQALGRGTVRGTSHRINPAQRVSSMRLPVPSVQLAPTVHGAVLLVNGRSAVRIRSPAPRSEGFLPSWPRAWNVSWNECHWPTYPDVMPRVAKGHIEQLPSGSFRVSVYAGTDPLTRRATSPQDHGQDRAAGAHRARQAAQGSVRRPHARVGRDRGEAHGRVRGGGGVGRVHAADQ